MELKRNVNWPSSLMDMIHMVTHVYYTKIFFLFCSSVGYLWALVDFILKMYLSREKYTVYEIIELNMNVVGIFQI